MINLKKELITYSQSLDSIKKSILFARGDDLNKKLSKDSVGAGTTRTRF